MTSLHRPRGGLVAVLIGCAAATLLVLSACSSGPEVSRTPGQASAEQPASPQDDPQDAKTDAGTVTASIDGRQFTFTLTSCIMYQDSEVELSGPGGEAGSEVPSHLDGGLMQMDADVLGEFRISIGTDQAFDSTDEFLAIGAPTGGDLSVVEEGDGHLVTARTWNDQGTDLGTGTLHFTCR
ncbi:MAG: hypothetical protein WBA87_09255 [Microbacterium sp.]